MSQITAPKTRAPTTARKSVCDRTPSVSHIAAVAVQPAKYRTSPNLASMCSPVRVLLNPYGYVANRDAEQFKIPHSYFRSLVDEDYARTYSEIVRDLGIYIGGGLLLWCFLLLAMAHLLVGGRRPIAFLGSDPSRHCTGKPNS